MGDMMMDDLPVLAAPVPRMAQILGLGVSTVWDLIAAGRLETVCHGSRRLVLMESARRFIDELRAAPPKDARRNRNGAIPAAGSGRQRQRRTA